MGQYVMVEREDRWYFNLCASDGHILVSSLVFPESVDCRLAIESVQKGAKDAAVEDTTIESYEHCQAPKYRIYQDMSGKFYFRYFDEQGADIAESHKYYHKDSLLRRIERMRYESSSSIASPEM